MKIAHECLKFVLLLVVAGAAAWFWLSPWAVLPPALALLFVVWFFRDPERRPPDDPMQIVSPADGRIVRASGGKVSVFMNVFDVHVCRAPFAGSVQRMHHHSGSFLNAAKDAASLENERVEIDFDCSGHALKCTLVAGLIARRIVPKIEVGQLLERGQRLGLIQFGSRVDVELPTGARIEVEIGQRVRAGVSCLARFDVADGRAVR